MWPEEVRDKYCTARRTGVAKQLDCQQYCDRKTGCITGRVFFIFQTLWGGLKLENLKTI